MIRVAPSGTDDISKKRHDCFSTRYREDFYMFAIFFAVLSRPLRQFFRTVGIYRILRIILYVPRRSTFYEFRNFVTYVNTYTLWISSSQKISNFHEFIRHKKTSRIMATHRIVHDPLRINSHAEETNKAANKTRAHRIHHTWRSNKFFTQLQILAHFPLYPWNLLGSNRSREDCTSHSKIDEKVGGVVSPTAF